MKGKHSRFIEDKPGKHYLSQVIKANIIGNKAHCQVLPHVRSEEENLISMVFFLKIHQHSLSLRKHQKKKSQIDRHKNMTLKSIKFMKKY